MSLLSVTYNHGFARRMRVVRNEVVGVRFAVRNGSMNHGWVNGSVSHRWMSVIDEHWWVSMINKYGWTSKFRMRRRRSSR